MTRYVLTTIFAAAIIVVLFLFNPAEIAFPRCPIFHLTGLQCPGCGSQRAIHCLLNGSLEEAVRLNLLLVLSIPYIALYYILSTTYRDSKLKILLYHGRAVYVILAIIIAYTIARNIL